MQTLVEKISSTFVPRDVTVLYRISMSGTEPDRGVRRPGAGSSVALVSMPVSTRAAQSTSSALSTDTNSPSSDMFLRSKGCQHCKTRYSSRVLVQLCIDVAFSVPYEIL